MLIARAAGRQKLLRTDNSIVGFVGVPAFGEIRSNGAEDPLVEPAGRRQTGAGGTSRLRPAGAINGAAIALLTLRDNPT